MNMLNTNINITTRLHTTGTSSLEKSGIYNRIHFLVILITRKSQVLFNSAVLTVKSMSVIAIILIMFHCQTLQRFTALLRILDGTNPC